MRPSLPDNRRGVLTVPEAGFTLERHAPAPDLAGVIDLHWHVRWDLPPGASHVQGVLPFPCVNVGLGSDGPFVTGPVTARDDRVLHGAGHALGTRIAAGLFPVFAYNNLPAYATTDRTLTFAAAFGTPDGPRLEQDLAAAPDPATHRTLMEDFLRARLGVGGERTSAAALDPWALLANRVATALIDDPAPGALRVPDVAARFGLTTRALQRLFRTYVGLTPKQVLQRARLHEAVERVTAGTQPPAELAYDLGFADQAHFANAFRTATGRPPGRYGDRRF